LEKEKEILGLENSKLKTENLSLKRIIDRPDYPNDLKIKATGIITNSHQH
jgi:hypothetical protein